MHKVSTLCRNRLTKSLHYISTKVRSLPHYDGIGDVILFLDEFEMDVLKECRFHALDIALRSTPVLWWGMQKDNIGDWKEYL